MKTVLLAASLFLAPTLVLAQAAWWLPAEPESGEQITITYNANVGTIPAGSTDVILHWGVNQSGPGAWSQPPAEIWPAGTTLWSDNVAARSPLVPQGEGIWTIQIDPTSDIESIHFVVTDGTNWDSNDSANWDVYFGDVPVFVDVWHRFIFDPASAHYAGSGVPSSVSVAGQFNNWNMTADPMSQGPAGTWQLDKLITEGDTEYKFVVNGSDWTWDPDNPNVNSNDNGNSMLTLVPSTKPVFVSFNILDHLVVDTPQSIQLGASFRAPDTGEALDWDSAEARINGTVMAHTIVEDMIVVDLDLNSAGTYDIEFRLSDIDGDESQVNYAAGYFEDGWHAVDPANDDDGPGQWTYPTPFSGYADLRAMHLWEAAGGDTMRVGIELELLHEYSRVNLVLTSDLTVPLTQDHIGEELLTPDWEAGGLFLQLARPDAGSFDAAADNRLVLSYDPFNAGSELDVWLEGNMILANLPMDILEEHLGSWQEEWYFAAWTTLDGIEPIEEGAYEVYPAVGGEDTVWDCDAYDLLNVSLQFNENRMLANNSIGRKSALDALHRGFAGVTPDQVGPHMSAPGPVVRILTRGASSILAPKTIAGNVSANAVGNVRLVHTWDGGTDTTNVSISNNMWSLPVVLEDGVNGFQALAVDGEGEWGSSAVLEYILNINHAPRPAVDVSMHVDGYLRLYGGNTIDVDGDIAQWQWSAEAGNPAALEFVNATSSIARIENLPTTDGSYRIRLTVTDDLDHQDYAIGLFEVENGMVIPVGDDGFPLWVRDAVIYEIFLRSFDSEQNLGAVTERLDELVDLGVNCIWFMPIFEGPSDHGYAISDYMSIEADYGTLEDLQELVDEAHSRNIRIVLDMVINHSSIDHAWMQEAMEFGNYSQYRNYYMFNPDGSHDYYYDWYSLPNFNVSNADLKHDIFEMCRYWVEEIGVDGYRCDVAWGPMERDAQFWTEWRREIRRKRPDLLLLAEAGANDFSIYNNRFNLAYDWEFFWNVVNHLDTVTPGTLQDRISNFGFWQPDNALAFRFLENHDEDRLINTMSETVTRLGAALNFTIPGVPLIYAGQEVGESSPRGMINWSDPLELRPYYRHLAHLRNDYPQLRTNRVTQLTNDQSSFVYSFLREGNDPAGEGVVLNALNFSPSGRDLQVTIDPVALGMSSGTWYRTNLMNADVVQYDDGVPSNMSIALEAWEPGIYLLAAESAQVEVQEPPAVIQSFELGAPFPNPFNPKTSIPFAVPARQHLRIDVYNIQGQLVETLLNERVEAGRHILTWQAGQLASGVYMLHATTAGQSQSRKILYLK